MFVPSASVEEPSDDLHDGECPQLQPDSGMQGGSPGGCGGRKGGATVTGSAGALLILVKGGSRLRRTSNTVTRLRSTCTVQTDSQPKRSLGMNLGLALTRQSGSFCRECPPPQIQAVPCVDLHIHTPSALCPSEKRPPGNGTIRCTGDQMLH